MIAISWISFYLLPNNIGPIYPILITLVASIATIKMTSLKHLDDNEFIRKQYQEIHTLAFNASIRTNSGSIIILAIERVHFIRTISDTEEIAIIRAKLKYHS